MFINYKAVFVYLGMIVFGLFVGKEYQKRKHFYVRLVIALIVFLIADCFVWMLYPVNFTGVVFDILFSLYMMMLISEAFFTFLFLYEEPVGNILLQTTISYIILDIGSQITSLLRVIPLFEKGHREFWFEVPAFLIMTTCSSVVLHKIFEQKKLSDMRSATSIKVIFSVLFVLTGLVVARLQSHVEDTLYTVIAFAVYSMLSDILLLFIMFFAFKDKEKTQTIADIKGLLIKGAEQESVRKELVNELNIFAHDWKNRSLLYSDSDKLAEEISHYDNFIKTGNPALDVVLYEKMKTCNKEEITFTCMADGALLDFMEPSDLCAMIGNALDNAIEGCRKVSVDLPRDILLKISEDNGKVIVRLENSKRNENCKLKNGILCTDKADAVHHGYGMISMRQICENYGGMLFFSDEGETFRLSFVFKRNEN